MSKKQPSRRILKSKAHKFYIWWLYSFFRKDLPVICAFNFRGHYVGIHTSNFRDFMLKPELSRAIVDCGFEHPSEGLWSKNRGHFLLPLPNFSPARMYSSSSSGYGHHLPGKVWDGKNSRFCIGNPSSTYSYWWWMPRRCPLSYQRAGVSNPARSKILLGYFLFYWFLVWAVF